MTDYFSSKDLWARGSKDIYRTELRQRAVSDAENFLKVNFLALNKIKTIDRSTIAEPYIRMAIEEGIIVESERDDYLKCFLTRCFMGKIGES